MGAIALMDISSLKNWVIKHDVEKRTQDHFWVAFENYMKEEPQEFEHVFSEFSKDKLSIILEKIALILGNYPEFDYNHVVSYSTISYKGNLIGEYRLFFHLTGEVDDDYFIIE